MKNLTERLLALIPFVVFSLFIILPCMLIIWLESEGSPIFRQRRIGKNGKVFLIFKLRTMLNGEIEGPALTPLAHRIQQHSRVTPFGLLLRKCHFDELPQILNVINGTMSFVGPRPFSESQVHENKFYAPRDCNVLPGITGLWQISLVEGMDPQTKENLDREYCKNKSFLLDLKILSQTPLFILKKKTPKHHL